MEIEFAEGPSLPRPPDDVRFVAVTAEPYPDGRRVKLSYELTPFLQRPSVEIRLQDPQGRDLGSVTVIETVGRRFSLTAHLRGEVPSEGRVVVVSLLRYEGKPDVDRHELSVDLPGPEVDRDA